ncbi:hypothetical protein RB195_024087 [Necator americanus]|uniref:Uncharacterized protein n=1 Tax=Necator americanus TaxID=51031 RepID=A0ABR1EMM5_NECAM
MERLDCTERKPLRRLLGYFWPRESKFTNIAKIRQQDTIPAINIPKRKFAQNPMESPTDFDSDLYDRVNYLNLMNQVKDRDSTRKCSRRALDDSEAPSPRPTDQTGMIPPAPPDPHIKYLWNESVDINDMAGMEQNDMLQLRIMLGIERISTETLSRYNVRGHVDGYDQPAILYPRYRGLASRIRIPAGLKVIRKVGDRMEKENYPISNETFAALPTMYITDHVHPKAIIHVERSAAA